MRLVDCRLALHHSRRRPHLNRNNKTQASDLVFDGNAQSVDFQYFLCDCLLHFLTKPCSRMSLRSTVGLPPPSMSEIISATNKKAPWAPSKMSMSISILRCSYPTSCAKGKSRGINREPSPTSYRLAIRCRTISLSWLRNWIFQSITKIQCSNLAGKGWKIYMRKRIYSKSLTLES